MMKMLPRYKITKKGVGEMATWDYIYIAFQGFDYNHKFQSNMYLFLRSCSK